MLGLDHQSMENAGPLPLGELTLRWTAGRCRNGTVPPPDTGPVDDDLRSNERLTRQRQASALHDELGWCRIELQVVILRLEVPEKDRDALTRERLREAFCVLIVPVGE